MLWVARRARIEMPGWGATCPLGGIGALYRARQGQGGRLPSAASWLTANPHPRGPARACWRRSDLRGCVVVLSGVRRPPAPFQASADRTDMCVSPRRHLGRLTSRAAPYRFRNVRQLPPAERDSGRLSQSEVKPAAQPNQGTGHPLRLRCAPAAWRIRGRRVRCDGSHKAGVAMGCGARGCPLGGIGPFSTAHQGQPDAVVPLEQRPG
jgi:hypothetical protein